MQMKSCPIKIVCFFANVYRKNGKELLIEEYEDVSEQN